MHPDYFHSLHVLALAGGKHTAMWHAKQAAHSAALIYHHDGLGGIAFAAALIVVVVVAARWLLAGAARAVFSSRRG